MLVLQLGGRRGVAGGAGEVYEALWSGAGTLVQQFLAIRTVDRRYVRELAERMR